MNKGHILLTMLFISIFSLGLSAQNDYPAPPENNSKEVMDRYQKAVDQWYLQNPKTDEVVENTTPEESIEQEVIEGPNLTSKDIPEEAVVWKLSTVKIIENGVIDEKLNDYQQSFVNQYMPNRLRVFIHKDKFLYIQKNKGIVKKFVLNISEKSISLKEDDCPKCSEQTLDLINYDSSSIITETEIIDDKGNHFNVRFSYVPL